MKPLLSWRFIALIGLLAACGTRAAGSDTPTASTEPNVVNTGVVSLPPIASMPNVVLASSSGQLAILRDGGMGNALTGIVAADDKTIIATSSSAGRTTLSWVRIDDGSLTATVELDGDLQAMATDVTGKIVGLVSRTAEVGTSEVVIASSAGERFRQTYDSELQPEGFSNAYETDLPTGMFVIEFLDPPPADHAAPRNYRVRVLTPIDGQLSLPWNLRDKGQFVDEEMLGFSRTHIASPANGLLFTLYRGVEADESNYAFVHTLGFVNGVWCLDLPHELALERLSGAVALANHEEELLVVSANGFIAEFVITDITDPERLPVPRRTQQAWSGADGAGAPALAEADGRLLVGLNGTLRWIDTTSLSGDVTQTVDLSIEAVALPGNDDALVAGDGQIVRLSAAGAIVGTAVLPEGLGPVSRMLVFGD